MKMIQVIAIGLIIFLIGPAAGQGQFNYQPNKPSHHEHPEVPRITALEAGAIYQQGKLILADAHEPEVFARKHIIGSISLPSGKGENMNIKLPQNFIIAFYCE